MSERLASALGAIIAVYLRLKDGKSDGEGATTTTMI